ncbi:MAG: beta-hydroxyacyl-ACP dehydratase [Phycisphaerales bacterium]|nr:beta-hydroxyacyl-ACP dehydratase [Phycisphaerales bacterium]
MKFALVDRIVECTPPEKLVAIKAVSLAEEYLADHFPTFPVLPGVLMLESLAESAAWLVRAASDFSHSVILLSSARNVTYKSFMKPGHLLRTEVTCRRMAPGESEFLGTGFCEEREVVKARFSLRHFNLVERDEALAGVDSRIITQARERFAQLWNGS